MKIHSSGKEKINSQVGIFSWWFKSYTTHICIFYYLQSVSLCFNLFNTHTFWDILKRYYFILFIMRKWVLIWLNILPKATKLSGRFYIIFLKNRICVTQLIHSTTIWQEALAIKMNREWLFSLLCNPKFSEKGMCTRRKWFYCPEKGLNKVGGSSLFFYNERNWGADHNRISVS